MRKGLFASLLGLLLLAFTGSVRAEVPTAMYGGNGGHNNGDSINDGWLVTLNDSNAAVTPVGHPDNVKRLSGIAFNSAGALYATTLTGGGFPPPPPSLISHLIKINPDTGAQLEDIGAITDGAGGPAISIADLAFQPCTDVLYGVRAPVDGLGGEGNIYTIDTATGVATLVGKTGLFFGSIAFAPNGTLYMSGAGFGPPNLLLTLNPVNAAVQSSVTTAHGYGALGIRRTDGVIFGGTGDSGNVYKVDPATGAETFVGNTGQNFVGDFDFRPVGGPVPGPQLNCLSPALVWIGLKNSDDVGTKFDLLAEVLHNNIVIGSGELDSVPGGSSGFNNAKLRAISLALSSVGNLEGGDTVCIRLSVRIATKVAGHRSGTARLWFNDAAANSRFDLRVGTFDAYVFLRDNFILGNLPGTVRKSVDVFVDKLRDGNAWKPFGTWCFTYEVD